MIGPDELARQVAEWMVASLASAPGRPAVALSGGSTPKRLYSLLATDAFAAKLPWDRVHWFFGDERFVPPDDPASNAHMVQEALLHLAPPDHVHPIPTVGLDPAASAAAYERTLRDFHGASLAEPLFHIVLLGLGSNGHTASLFPDTPAALAERTAWAVPVTPAGEKTRITLTYPALESCRHAAFVVSGADKRDMVAEIRSGHSALPAARYRPAGELHWFVDDAASG